MTGLARRMWDLATNEDHFWRRVLKHGALDRQRHPAEWMCFRQAVSRLGSVAAANSGPILSRPLEGIFPGILGTFAEIAPVPGSPYSVSWQELAILSAIVRLKQPMVVVEFGTFDGRTTLHLAQNAPPAATVHSIDRQSGRFDFGSDALFFEGMSVGERVQFQSGGAQVVLHTGDSHSFDWSAITGRADVVFVDADHSFDAVMADSTLAKRLLGPTGVVIWHDYFTVKDVTRALVELNKTLSLVHISGTSLVIWQSDNAVSVS